MEREKSKQQNQTFEQQAKNETVFHWPTFMQTNTIPYFLLKPEFHTKFFHLIYKQQQQQQQHITSSSSFDAQKELFRKSFLAS